MRILLANEARAGGGGVETYLSTVASALAARGHQIALVVGNTAAQEGPTAIRAAECWSVADAGMAAVLRRVREWHPDVGYSHNMRRLEVDETLASTVPVVKMMHGYFGTCVSGQKTFLFPAERPCTRRCGPACIALYAPRRCGRLRPVEAVRNYRWAARQRALFTRYHAVVVASRHMRDEYLGHGVAAERLHAIPLFAPASTFARASGTDIDVLFLGRMTPLKGTGVLVAVLRGAASRLGRTISVVLAGDGPARARLEASLAGTTDVAAAFPGWVDAKQRAGLLSRARLLTVPSVWPEPFGLVGLEAALAGVPSVAFDVGGIPEWLTDGDNGRLVPLAAGANGIADAIADTLRAPDRLEQLAAGARRAAARFTVDAHVSRLEHVFEAVRSRSEAGGGAPA